MRSNIGRTARGRKREEILQSEGDQQSEISWARRKPQDGDSVEPQSSAQDPGAHSQPKLEDVTSKESFDKVEIWLSEINKACLRRYQQRPWKPEGAKEFSKSEAELVDVMDTLQQAISIIEKGTAKNSAFLHKEIDTKEPEQHQDSSRQKELKVKSLQRTVFMMNTAALVGIDQFLQKIETLKTVGSAHNTANDVRHAVAKIAVMSKDRRDSIQSWSAVSKWNRSAFAWTRRIATLQTTSKKISMRSFNNMTSWKRAPTHLRKFGANPRWYEWYRWYEWNERDDWEWVRLKAFTPLPVEKECKCSQLHPNAFLTTSTTNTNTNTTIILQNDSTQHDNGLALWLRSSCTLGHTGGSRQDTHGTHVPEKEGRGWPDVTSTKTTNDNRRQDTDKRQDKRACNDQVLRNVNSHTVVLDSYTINHTFFFFSQSITPSFFHQSITPSFFSQSITPSFFSQSITHVLFLQSHVLFFFNHTFFFFLQSHFFSLSITPFFVFSQSPFFSQSHLFFSPSITLFFSPHNHLFCSLNHTFFSSLNHTFFFFSQSHLFFPQSHLFFFLNHTFFFFLIQSQLFFFVWSSSGCQTQRITDVRFGTAEQEDGAIHKSTSSAREKPTKVNVDDEGRSGIRSANGLTQGVERKGAQKRSACVTRSVWWNKHNTENGGRDECSHERTTPNKWRGMVHSERKLRPSCRRRGQDSDRSQYCGTDWNHATDNNGGREDSGALWFPQM